MKDTTHVAGYPLDYLSELQKFASEEKENIVVFPHRINDDKAPWFFDMLENYVHKELGRTDIHFVCTQAMKLNKEEYYKYLGKCKVIFSANKHENLGIGTFEAMMLGCIPVVPDKLSYKEMYATGYKYPCPPDFYDNWEKYIDMVAQIVVEHIDYYDVRVKEEFKYETNRIYKHYFTADKIVEIIKNV